MFSRLPAEKKISIISSQRERKMSQIPGKGKGRQGINCLFVGKETTSKKYVVVSE